jgi:hypothetical protein
MPTAFVVAALPCTVIGTTERPGATATVTGLRRAIGGR